jgi:phosphocarrier protein FPr
MIPLTADTVRLGASPASKDEAVRDAADLLVAAGSIDPGYAESMLGREKVANTYLGEGIAIPHGLLKDRDLIRATAISVV